jgi:hypothetical protein
MKYIITEDQNERIIKLIKKVGESYSGNLIEKTEMNDIEWDDEYKFFRVIPTFHTKRFFVPLQAAKHELAQRIEDFIGLPVHAPTFKHVRIDDPENYF